MIQKSDEPPLVSLTLIKKITSIANLHPIFKNIYISKTWQVIVCSFLFFLFACKQDIKIAPTSPPPPLYFSKNWRANFSFKTTDRFVGSHYLNETFNIYILDSTGISQFSSKDDGRSWTKRKNIFCKSGITYPIIIDSKLIGVVTIDEYKYGGQINYYSNEGDLFGEPSPIRDSNWGTFSAPVFATDSLNNLYCIWTDYRNGNPDIYFSSSFDKGETWNENIKINDDNSGQEQTTGNILYTQNGRLCVIWNDNRSPNTLFDLYCSSSTDNGKTWSANIKINDDTTRAWQMISFAGRDKSGNIYLTWTDYRDISKSGDHISKIYFSKSSDNGRTWSRNIPIHSPADGSDSYPVLLVTEEGNLQCAWKNTDDNQLYDILFSYSSDGGRNWSSASRVNDDLERVIHHIAFIFQNKKNNLIVGCFDWRESKQEIYISESRIVKDTSRMEREMRGIIAYKREKQNYYFSKGNILFRDNFEQEKDRGWENRSGCWIIKDNTYVGYGATEAQSFIGNQNWDDYAYEGQFNLDAIDHRTAYIYFRVLSNNGIIKYYRINNFFRTGVKVEYFDGSALIPVAEYAYPIHKDRWYGYRVEVKGNQLNYFLDDSLIISSDRITKIANGKIGVGAFASPTYFRKIKVTEIK
ncbi:MAG: exo-alpha-sialidase [bacterium]